MTIYQLECFIAVAEELNFSAAAERLFTTQPAITYQINALEKQRDSGTLTGEDILVIYKQIDYLHIDINHQKNAVYQQGKTEESLSQKAVQERAVQDEKTTAKLDKQTESQAQEQTEQVSILQHESTTQDETRPLQVLQNAQQVEDASQSKKTSTIKPTASTK